MTLGITTIQRNRAPWIKEWVVFHYLVGFRKFYVYLHNCSDDTEKILNDLKKQFDITIFIVDPNLERSQSICYQDSYNNFGEEVDWMAFIDGDEFLFPSSAQSMEIALTTYSNKTVSALGSYWSCFGSSGHVEEPTGLLIENYRYRAPNSYYNNRHIKSIVRGGLGESVQVSDPHFFQTPSGTYDELLRPVTRGLTDYEPTYEQFRINHYVTQSRSHFVQFKSIFSTPDGSPPRGESYWEEHNRNEILDNSMDKFIKPVKDSIAFI
ncbi:glycosyltransferase family 92 protein [Candidatus Roizmanbacteria bacterium]|nr:glycosyltransferase family 92 protein [Candidatus Roizmanbacteria bacterium]